jgi:hypothetical protein
MNPPYVRHEKLKDAVLNSKKTIRRSLWRYNSYLDSTHNLYAYFLIKADLHLKEGGKMVAITYDSWINSKFGESLIHFLEDKFMIESITQYEEDAFENAEVGATVIEVIKSAEDSEFEYKKFKSPEQESPEVSRDLESLNQIKYAASDHDFKLEGDLFTKLSKLNSGKIRRGISPKTNKYFLFEKRRFEETTELVKDVKSIDNFEVNQGSIKFLLDAESPSGEVADYIEEVREKIIEQDRYKTLTSEIREREQWYKINKVDSGNFLFNYYIRNRIRFIHNPERKLASNNFYILNIAENEALMAALLNSSFTRLGVLREGRNQGSGLRKIQVYEFENVPVINPDKLNKSERLRLEQLGRKLLTDESNSEKILQEIDERLLSKYNNFTGQSVSPEELKRNLE